MRRAEGTIIAQLHARAARRRARGAAAEEKNGVGCVCCRWRHTPRGYEYNRFVVVLGGGEAREGRMGAVRCVCGQ